MTATLGVFEICLDRTELGMRAKVTTPHRASWREKFDTYTFLVDPATKKSEPLAYVEECVSDKYDGVDWKPLIIS
jgi:hypothetical protein